MSDNQANRNMKASVFEDLFSSAEMRLALYKVLHPEDTDATVEDVEEITLSHILLKGRYNDLGMIVRNRLIVLVEAQSTWSVNIIPRCVMYLADTWNRYGVEKQFHWYGEKKVELPEAELYVVYTGKKKIEKNEISLSEEFFGGRKCAIDATVKVLRYDGGNDILDQYFVFCKVLNEQRDAYPDDDRRAVIETIRICVDQGVLKEYLQKRSEEVVNIMLTLFTQQQAHEMEILSERKEAREELARKSAKEMYEDGMSVQKIAKYLGFAVDVIKEWLGIKSA